MVNVLGVSGSLRRSSTNRLLLDVARSVAPVGVRVDLYEGIGDLPHFNPDLAPEREPAVVEWSNAVRRADALVVSSPEYARGIPGSLKNALDWLVGGDAFVAKPFALLCASGRSPHAQQALLLVLTTMSGVRVEEACATVPLLGREISLEAALADASIVAPVRAALESLARFVANGRAAPA